MASVGNTTSIAFTTTSFVAKIIDFSGPSISVASVDTTTTSSVGTDQSGGIGRDLSETVVRSKLPGSVDFGQLSMTIEHNQEAAIPVTGATETVTITFPTTGSNTNGATYAMTAFVSAYEVTGAGLDSHIRANMTIDISGEVTFTAGS
jgi:hypothetical protein